MDKMDKKIQFHSDKQKAELPHSHGEIPGHLLDHMPAVEEFQTVSNLFKLLSDPSRIKIFWLLCHCEECGINIAAMVDMSAPAIAHHLRLLKDSGLIVSRRDGKEVYYKAAESEQAQHLHLMIEKMVEISCPEKEHEEEKLPLYPTQEEIVAQIHDFLIENIDDRHTIEELARTYHINPTTLKECFRRQYGQPIATYVKEYRMKEAEVLLTTTDDSIASIAESVGYESQGKFTGAFKAYSGMLPTEYRKQRTGLK